MSTSEAKNDKTCGYSVGKRTKLKWRPLYVPSDEFAAVKKQMKPFKQAPCLFST